MHRMIHIITWLHLGIISPSNSTIVAALRFEIFKSKHSGRTTFTIYVPSWYEVRHDRVEYEELGHPPDSKMFQFLVIFL